MQNADRRIENEASAAVRFLSEAEASLAEVNIDAQRANWVAENIASLLPNPPLMTAGEVVASG